MLNSELGHRVVAFINNDLILNTLAGDLSFDQWKDQLQRKTD